MSHRRNKKSGIIRHAALSHATFVMIESLEGRRMFSAAPLKRLPVPAMASKPSPAQLTAKAATAGNLAVTSNNPVTSKSVNVKAGTIAAASAVVLPAPARVLSSAVADTPRAVDAAAADTAFAHPGLLFTETDFTRMRAMIAAGTQPVADGWNALVGDSFSQNNLAPRPLETVLRGGTGQNYAQMVIDMQRTYQLALRWKVSGETIWADLAVAKLNAWSTVHKVLGGNADRFLASGLYGFGWAAAADVMRSYSGWAAADVTKFQNYLVDIYVPMQRDFLTNHNGAAITNYWANWDLANIEGMMAIGIFADRRDLYDEAMTYLKTGGGNGALDKMVYFMHSGNLAQWQETGRDQGHTVLGMQLFGHIAQMAWQQGDDLFSYNNYQFAAAAEYIAKYNLGNDVPYTDYFWGNGQNGAFSSQVGGASPASRGDMDVGYELIYAHFHDRLGLAMPYSQQRIAARGTEWRGSGDDLGFGTLTYRMNPVTTGLTPKVTAREKGYNGVELNWYGTSNATGYNVYRSTSAAGAYLKIASNVTGPLTYADRDLTASTYFYKITGITPTGETGDSNVVSAAGTTLPQTTLDFNENTGVTAADGTGNNHAATLNGGATWTTGKTGSAVALNGTTGYVSLPDGVVAGLNDFTISANVFLNSNATWSRIFDFGDARGRWMMLTPRNANGQVEFATSTVYGYNKQWVSGTAALPTNQWVNVAVTLADRVATIYVNGVAVGSNANMDFAPFQFASTSRNWLGRSQYSSDPYLNGKIDDFQISRGAMKAGEMYALATGNAAPAVPAAPATFTATAAIGNTINLAWSAVSGASGYTVRRSTSATGPFTTLASLVAGTSYSDTGRTAGTTYFYQVSGYNTGGDSMPARANAVALPPLSAVPGSLVAVSNSPTTILLTWGGAANAATYSVKRSFTRGGPYATIATNLTALTYTDTGLTPGTAYYYVVTATNASGTSANSNESNDTPSDLRARLTFNEGLGSTTADISGNEYDGTLVSGATWSASGKLDNAVQLDGTDDYVTLPTGVVGNLTNYTISAWVNPDIISTWSRVFDFGTGTTNYMFLSPRGGSNVVRFGIRTASVAEQQINGTAALTAGVWSHVAVTWSNNVGILYVNGAEVGRNSAMTLNPTSLGATHLNYVGKSQFPDPYLKGRVDDLRIYSRALTATDVNGLATQTTPAAPTGVTATAGDGQIALGWTAPTNATSYTVRRSTVSGGPYTVVATNLANPTFADTNLSNGTRYFYTVTASNVVDAGAMSTEVAATPVSATPPALLGLQVNDGSAQRSMVKSMTLTFSQAVTLDAGAVTLATHSSLSGVTGLIPTYAWNTPDGGYTYVVTFSGNGVTGGSIANGLYDVTVHAGLVRGASGVALAADQTSSFYRFFADSDGDHTVSISDFNGFAIAFGASQGNPLFDTIFDFDADGTISISDFNLLAISFGQTLE